jgi:hypothetical protein
MPTLTAVPPVDHSLRRRRKLREMNPLPLFLAEQLAEAERRHRTLVTLEALFAETPVWCIRQRRAIRKAISSHLPSLWSWS